MLYGRLSDVAIQCAATTYRIGQLSDTRQLSDVFNAKNNNGLPYRTQPAHYVGVSDVR